MNILDIFGWLAKKKFGFWNTSIKFLDDFGRRVQKFGYAVQNSVEYLEGEGEYKSVP